MSTTAATSPDTAGTEPRRPGYQRVQSTILVDAPIETVWDVVADPAHYVEAIEWVADVTREDDGPLGVGSVYVERARPGLRWGTYRWEVAEFDPPHRAVQVHESGEIDVYLTLGLEAVGEATTRFTQVMDFRALPAFRPLGYVVERTAMRWKMQRDFDRAILPSFKAMAEARAGGD